MVCFEEVNVAERPSFDTNGLSYDTAHRVRTSPESCNLMRAAFESSEIFQKVYLSQTCPEFT